MGGNMGENIVDMVDNVLQRREEGVVRIVRGV